MLPAAILPLIPWQDSSDIGKLVIFTFRISLLYHAAKKLALLKEI